MILCVEMKSVFSQFISALQFVPLLRKGQMRPTSNIYAIVFHTVEFAKIVFLKSLTGTNFIRSATLIQDMYVINIWDLQVSSMWTYK